MLHKKTALSFLFVIASMVVLASCTSTPDRPSNSSPNKPIINEPEVTPTPISVEQSTITTLPGSAMNTGPSTGFEKSVLIQSGSPDMVQEVINQSSPAPVQTILIQDQAVRAVDDLLYQRQLMERIQQSARVAQSSYVNTLLWSREIHGEGTSFVFAPDTPLVIARQTAYRNVLRQIPELDGIVLSMEDAVVPPWNAHSLLQDDVKNPAERARFVIDMVKQVVVDELGKQLWIYLPDTSPESLIVADALQALGDAGIDVITPSTALAQSRVVQRSYDVHWLADLSGDGTKIFSVLPDGFLAGLDEMSSGQMDGLVVNVGSEMHPVWDSVNGLNWHLFQTWMPGDLIHDTVWDDWIGQTLSVLPVSEEGRTLRTIIEEGTNYSQAIDPDYLLDPNIQDHVPGDAAAYLQQKYEQPTTQLLTDLAQEQYEILHWCSSAAQESNELLQPIMRPKLYQDLTVRLERLRWLASLRYYAQQSQFGYRLWKQTRDEQEALYLESHLLSLEEMLRSTEAAILPGRNRDELQQRIASIRSDFPRVLIGATPRYWNRISGVRIHHSNVNEVVLYWQTDYPSFSRVYLSDTPPVFNRMIEGDKRAVTYHQIVIRDFQPTKNLRCKIQAITTDGQVTNSGAIPIHLSLLDS